MSYNPGTGYVYIPTIHDASYFDASKINVDDWKNNPTKGGIGVGLSDPIQHIYRDHMGIVTKPGILYFKTNMVSTV